MGEPANSAMIFAIIMIGLIVTGVDNITATATTLNNLGPGLGQVAGTFADMTDTAITLDKARQTLVIHCHSAALRNKFIWE